MPGLNDVVSQMRQTLAVTDPDLDTSTGTTTRKILDVVGEAAAEAYIDQHLITYQYDIDAKSEADLDEFCAMFGIIRYGARRATGSVIFSRGQGDLTQPLLIPVNTQVGTGTATVVTVVPAFMDNGVRSISVPVMAVLGGLSGNVGAGLLTNLLTPVQGITDVTNIQPITGGTPQESDTALRARWRRTAFRNLAGVEQMYLGIANDDDNVFNANVVGSSKRHREQVQVVGGSAVSTLAGAAFIYPDSAVFGPNIDAGDVLLRDHDYKFDAGANPPIVQTLATTYPSVDGAINQFEGAIMDLDFEYQPKASRNDPSQNIFNRVDVYVAGKRAREAVQSVIFSQNKRFSPAYGDLYSSVRFVREDDTSPQVNNVFIPLAYGPILSVPPTLSVEGQPTYVLGTDYWVVHEDSSFGYTPTSLFGLEWNAANLPPSGAIFVIGDSGDYTYNDVVLRVQTNIEAARLLGTDVKVHQAKQIGLRFNLAVVYSPGYSQDAVNEQIREALVALLTNFVFGTVLQASDVLQFVHNVQGVDNVRFLHQTDDSANYAMQRVVNGVVTHTYASTEGRAIDIPFADNEIPVFDSVGGGTTVNTPRIKAQNSFGVAG